MSVDGWSRILVLGGIRSGKSEFAESLVRDVPTVRYVATGTTGTDDPEWAARIASHRLRRPAGWTTDEVGGDPARLVDLLRAAGPAETILVDDLGGWVTALLDPAHRPADGTATIDELGSAVRDCAARLVLVSPEVGLTMVPTTPLGRAFTDTLGTTNQTVARACDAVVLVVAGQPSWLKGTAGPAAVAPPRPAVPAQPGAGRDGDPGAGRAGTDGTAAVPVLSAWTGLLGAVPEVLRPTVPAEPAGADGPPSRATTVTASSTAADLVIEPGMDLPMPDEHAGPAALDRLATLDLPGPGLGNLARVVRFAAATQGTATPVPWRSVRVLLLHGDHAGGASAGTVPGESARRAAQARAGNGPLARLAADAGATLQVVETPTAGPIEEGPALSPEDVDAALRHGWRLAEEAVETGVEVLVLAACGAGTEAAVAAVLAAMAGAEPAAILGRVVTPDGQVDDTAWMARCAAVREALHRTRRSPRDARDVLAELGGGDIAVATGILLGATARRTPVLLDGPVGVAAGLVSRDLAGQARHWCLLPDHGGHPAVRLGAEILDWTPLLDLRLGLGEGAAALAALPLLRAALTLAATLGERPSPAGEPTAAQGAGVAPESADAVPETDSATTAEAAAAGGPGRETATGGTGQDGAGADRGPAAEPAPGRPADGARPEPPPAEPEPGDGADDDGFIEPQPAGPGPTAVPEDTPTRTPGA
ncbi:bifunctional adenosylcobinamide kinase/adenosylcobinamide-phosphate guanylyltransferase [Micromonospora sp. HM5-17]|jgi:nicotinate-nucleotide--dimethylbenzimidazole phosphoribosyltransferase|uniref:bifunctional adenosylcobinamide kinase/adenosylcobinamide-phosphate guanylyltransferase n=1 Tax=Micromonospora sp. HM5-17 TaxID=2487710 RepID=UPI000F4A7AB1|nr:bifunctional adenosylcobinamide kinase/adenosylcobinamide-phosphate guanylyltransferase [Micromonospora sp. HM5-17]ROT31349.1 cobalamin biosynthesis protein [Micromonospora sp. HM5-17]